MSNENFDNSWFSERIKTWIVAITMTILIGGALYGFYAAQVWKAEREEAKAATQIEMIYSNE